MDFNWASLVSVHVSAVLWQRWFSAGLLRAPQVHPAQRLGRGDAVVRRPGEQQAAQVGFARLHECVWRWRVGGGGGTTVWILVCFISATNHVNIFFCGHVCTDRPVSFFLSGYFEVTQCVTEPFPVQCQHFWRPPVGANAATNTSALKKKNTLNQWVFFRECSFLLDLVLSVWSSWYLLRFCVCVIHRSLCVDALIELSDENADWKLSFDEFLNCLKPGFNPPEKSELKVTPILWHKVRHHKDAGLTGLDIQWAVEIRLSLCSLVFNDRFIYTKTKGANSSSKSTKRQKKEFKQWLNL